ncbi:hypothetical protein C7T87_06300 [Xanthomonas hortorum pv. hederae]|nr:hypothetical protein C7T87_06300 [Xanthomonas hortorum pv. hederae]
MRCKADRARRYPNNARHKLLSLCAPTLPTGPCPPTLAGPYAAWMPRKSLICSESGSLGVESRRGPP